MITDPQVRKLRRLDRQGAAQRGGGGPSRHGCQDRPQVSPARQAAQRGQTHGQGLADSPRPLRRGLARSGDVAPGSTPAWKPRRCSPTCSGASPAASPTANCGPCSGGVKRWRAEHGPAKEVFFAQVHHPGRLCCQRLHPLHRPGRDHQRQPVRPPDLPLRADLLELGDRHGLLLRELGEPQRGLAERLVGTGRRAATAPHRSADGGGAAGRGRAGGVQASATRRCCGTTACRARRSRRARATRTATSSRATTSFKRALDQALMLRGSRDFAGRDGYAAFLRQLFAQRNAGPAGPPGGGAAAAAAVAGAPAGGVQAADRCGWTAGSTIHVRGQRLLGGQPADRRVGRGPAVRRAGRGLVRPEAGGASCRGCGAGASTGSSTGTSSTGWSASRGRSPTTATATTCSPAAASAWPTTCCCEQQPARAAKEYLRILHLAARESEAGVEAALARPAGRGRAAGRGRRGGEAASAETRAGRRPR